FSSRRRHTRLVSDWSSDVCSSDLGSCRKSKDPSAEGRLRCCKPANSRRYSSLHRGGKNTSHGSGARAWPPGKRWLGHLVPARPRSEERRVGKEGQYGGGEENEQEE